LRDDLRLLPSTPIEPMSLVVLHPSRDIRMCREAL